MQPVGGTETWDVPKIESAGALADWLEVKAGELDWFADLKGLAYRKSGPKLGHYHYRVLAKDNGIIRLIEAPKLGLKELHRRFLTAILVKIPAHPAAHGLVTARSLNTVAAPHVVER